MKTKVKFSIFVVIIILVASFAIFQKLFTENEKKSSIRNDKNTKEISVNAIKVKSEIKNDRILTSGTFLPDENIQIKSEIAGKIQQINFEEGKPVKQNQLLIKLKSDDIIAQINKAKERLKFIELTEKRQKTLLKNEGISQEEYDITLNELTIQKAELEYLKALLDKTEIYAPFNGIAGLRYFSVGSFISTNDVISNIYKNDRLKLEFSIPQKYYNLLNIGQEVEFNIPPSSELYKAIVYAVEPQINPTTRTLIARAYYSNRDLKIKPGSFAEITIKTSSNSNKMMLPTQALIPDLESEKVYIFENGIAKLTNVKTGLRTETEIEITEGLKEGDIVITSGIIQLKPNSKVKITMDGK